MKLIIRGHIRDSLENLHLYNFIKSLKKDIEVEVYIYTWEKKEANNSWRPIILTKHLQKQNVTIDDIKKYFNDIQITHINICKERRIFYCSNYTLDRYRTKKIIFIFGKLKMSKSAKVGASSSYKLTQ